MTAVLTGAGRALPTSIEQSAVWDGFFADHYAGVRAARRVFTASGVRRRHAVANPLDEDISAWSTGARMQRYVQEALPLGKQAVAAALDSAGLAPGDVGLFAVATCTGYATPGLDIRLASDLGMPPGLQRLLVGHMGCYAALPGLAAVGDYLTARSPPAVLLCCELTSFPDEDAVAAAVAAGASGYVLKQVRGSALVTAVRTVADGGTLFDRDIGISASAARRRPAERDRRPAVLTEQERTVLRLIGEGLTNRQIGARMGLAEKTVKNYTSHLLAKLGLERRTQAAILATELRDRPD